MSQKEQEVAPNTADGRPAEGAPRKGAVEERRARKAVTYVGTISLIETRWGRAFLA